MAVTRRDFLLGAGSGAAALSLGCSLTGEARGKQGPDIVYILADDLGIGDVRCYNPQGRIPTPAIDALAARGMRFTDAHSASAVCTPTRYGILTGRYCWRTRLQNGVTWGLSRHLIAPGRLTVGELLRRRGYATACVGKWHLGWDWALKPGVTLPAGKDPSFAQIDFDRPITQGPTALGFDTFFGIPASLDMHPYVYVEGDRVVEPPTGRTAGKKGRAFYRAGPAAPGFRHDRVLNTLADRATGFIDRHCAARKEEPFFLYLPLTAPHTPILPSPEVRGRSGIGPYGDFVIQCDLVVAQVMEALRRNGRERNTLVVFTSDNGFSPAGGLGELNAKGHRPSHIYRGHKADIFEGGHRIPFIAAWPGRIAAGSTCAGITCQTDLLATAAEITDVALPADAGEDSVSILPLLTGRKSDGVREATVHHSINGSFSIRQGRWKLELCPGSGGWSAPRPKRARKLKLPPVQLYDLRTDPAERTNLESKHPEVVARLTRLLESYVARGRSTLGPAQRNDTQVRITR